MGHFNRRKRIRVFTFLLLGIIRDFYKESRLAKRIGSARARERMSKRHRKRAKEFCQKALVMGGVLIKLGQFLGTRVDVMPTEYIEELESLQDMVPPAPFEEVKAIVEKEFNKPINEVFLEFSHEAKASASLAQVYKAVLPDGTKVAVKVQRPDIEKLTDIDLATFAYLMEGVARFTNFGKNVDLKSLVDQFAKTTGDELDFIREGYNAEQFYINFKDSDIIYIPKVYWSHTTAKVLTLEYIDAIKINDYETLENRGISRSEVASEVVQSYLKQVLEYGFFHADPHPGNLFVVEGPEITFVDFGMVGEITPEMKQYLKDVVVGIALRDVEKIIQGFVSLGFLRRTSNLYSVKRAIAWTIDNYSRLTSKTVTFEDIEEINEDIKNIMREQPFTIPTEFAFLGRALGTLHGLATGLDPEFDMIKTVSPYVKNIVDTEKKNFQKLFVTTLTDFAKTLFYLPQKVDNLIESLNHQNLPLSVKSTEIVKAINNSSKRNSITSLTILDIVLIVSSIVLMSLNFRVESYICFAISFVVLIYILAKSLKK
jgi:predicted unusual protein kinase regulating ubiquinone biosynthesis (AarF/ABC1/UbiB family)